LKKFNAETDYLLEAPKTSGTQEITANDFVLIQFYTKATKVLYAGKFEEK
jgi:hypothetical protein